MSLKKKKIILVQLLLFLAGITLIFLTYKNNENYSSNEIIPEKTKSEINKKLDKNVDYEDTFYNIEYSGIDLSGNRYVLKAKEANNDKNNNEFVNLKFVDATFYFKDDTKLFVSSKFGLYNNRTLDMIFEKDVVGNHTSSQLYAEKAEYSSSEGLLVISNNVKIKDIRGIIEAEKLVFDINENKLNISSSERKKINANLNYK